MATATPRPKESKPQRPEPEAVPPLENGDRLTRAEFERRYDAMPHLKKAELIEGVVYVGSPVGHRHHGRPHAMVLGWLDRYLEQTPGVDCGADSSVRLDPDNMPQPDAFLYITPEAGGRVRIGPDDYLEVAPELVVEVASSSASYDLHDKLNSYRRNQVLEYVIWRARDRAIDWFIFREGRYVRLQPGADGLYRSEAFPGLWLDPRVLIAGDRAAVARALQQGLAGAEHAAFVARLNPATPPDR